MVPLACAWGEGGREGRREGGREGGREYKHQFSFFKITKNNSKHITKF